MQRVTVRIGGILLFENGLPHDESAQDAAGIMKRDTVDIEVSLGAGYPRRLRRAALATGHFTASAE